MKTKYRDRDVRIIRLLKRYKVLQPKFMQQWQSRKAQHSSLNEYGLNPPRSSRKTTQRHSVAATSGTRSNSLSPSCKIKKPTPNGRFRYLRGLFCLLLAVKTEPTEVHAKTDETQHADAHGQVRDYDPAPCGMNAPHDPLDDDILVCFG
jgi:hypothetical protein